MIDIAQQKGFDFYASAQDCVCRYLNMPVRAAPGFDLPAAAFNPLRNQYDASALINSLVNQRPSSTAYALYLVDVDLYAMRMNFIFGLADTLNCAAVVSSFRFRLQKTEAHLCTEIVHEIGHLLGLPHCRTGSCAMHFSHTVEDTNRKSASLCPTCRRKLEAL